MKGDKMRLRFCKGDAVIIATVFLVAALGGSIFFHKMGNVEGNKAVIYKEGQRIQELDLKTDGEFWVSGEYTNKIVVKNGKVAIRESDCPGEDCVQSGWISSGGRSIICLPNRVEIRIDKESEVDFIVH